ncbi:MAG: hypothetical protein AAB263_05055 [Planctomycetota bacterium]
MPDDPHLTVLTRLMDVSMMRERVHLANLGNQNTPGYRAQSVSFEDVFNETLDANGLDQALQVDPTISQANVTPMQPDGNDVSSEREVAALAKNQLLFNAYSQLARGKMKLISTAMSPAP